VNFRNTLILSCLCTVTLSHLFCDVFVGDSEAIILIIPLSLLRTPTSGFFSVRTLTGLLSDSDSAPDVYTHSSSLYSLLPAMDFYSVPYMRELSGSTPGPLSAPAPASRTLPRGSRPNCACPWSPLDNEYGLVATAVRVTYHPFPGRMAQVLRSLFRPSFLEREAGLVL